MADKTEFGSGRESTVSFEVGPIDSSDRGAQSVKVMVVDDEPAIVKVVAASLQAAGIQDTITTTDSRDVLSLLREHRPDVLLMDIKMPHIDGIDILVAMRHDVELCRIPVVVMSALPEDTTREQVSRLGAVSFLPKPLSGDEVIQFVRAAVAEKADPGS